MPLHGFHPYNGISTFLQDTVFGGYIIRHKLIHGELVSSENGNSMIDSLSGM